MIKILSEKVTEVLIEYPITRDDDHKLVCMVWIKEMGGQSNVKKISAWDFLAKFNNHKLANVNSIIRCRAKLQELNKDLRGEKYEDRHKFAGEVKEELINWAGSLLDGQ